MVVVGMGTSVVGGIADAKAPVLGVLGNADTVSPVYFATTVAFHDSGARSDMSGSHKASGDNYPRPAGGWTTFDGMAVVKSGLPSIHIASLHFKIPLDTVGYRVKVDTEKTVLWYAA